ncbi:hypothetical protein ACLOJK_035180 [Asimina triloba]
MQMMAVDQRSGSLFFNGGGNSIRSPANQIHHDRNKQATDGIHGILVVPQKIRQQQQSMPTTSSSIRPAVLHLLIFGNPASHPISSIDRRLTSSPLSMAASAMAAAIRKLPSSIDPAGALNGSKTSAHLPPSTGTHHGYEAMAAAHLHHFSGQM